MFLGGGGHQKLLINQVRGRITVHWTWQLIKAFLVELWGVALERLDGPKQKQNKNWKRQIWTSLLESFAIKGNRETRL